MLSLALTAALVSAPALSHPLLGTARSLAGSKFCRQYKCRLVAFGRFGDNPSYGPTYVLSAPGVAVKAMRYPPGAAPPTRRDIERAPTLIASMTVDARLPWPKLGGAGQVAADYFALVIGERFDPSLFSNCVQKGHFQSRRAEGLEDLIVVTDQAVVNCIYLGGKVHLAATVRRPER